MDEIVISWRAEDCLSEASSAQTQEIIILGIGSLSFLAERFWLLLTMQK